jgi:hypothetical protein
MPYNQHGAADPVSQSLWSLTDALQGPASSSALQALFTTCTGAQDAAKKLQAILQWLLQQPCSLQLLRALSQLISQQEDAKLRLLALEALKSLAWQLGDPRYAGHC